jgi:NAD(P)-dependent dehydrogenase (short-subunit alcohol dehydrogenase family)
MHPDDDNAITTEEKIWCVPISTTFDVSASASASHISGHRDLTMQVNLKGVWWGCKYAIQAMRNNPVDPAKGLQTGGSIINTASFVALLGAATPQLACKCDT